MQIQRQKRLSRIIKKIRPNDFTSDEEPRITSVVQIFSNEVKVCSRNLKLVSYRFEHYFQLKFVLRYRC